MPAIRRYRDAGMRKLNRAKIGDRGVAVTISRAGASFAERTDAVRAPSRPEFGSDHYIQVRQPRSGHRIDQAGYRAGEKQVRASPLLREHQPATPREARQWKGAPASTTLAPPSCARRLE